MTVKTVAFHVLMLPLYGLIIMIVAAIPVLLYQMVLEEGWMGVLAIWASISFVSFVAWSAVNK